MITVKKNSIRDNKKGILIETKSAGSNVFLIEEFIESDELNDTKFLRLGVKFSADLRKALMLELTTVTISIWRKGESTLRQQGMFMDTKVLSPSQVLGRINFMRKVSKSNIIAHRKNVVYTKQIDLQSFVQNDAQKTINRKSNRDMFGLQTNIKIVKKNKITRQKLDSLLVFKSRQTSFMQRDSQGVKMGQNSAYRNALSKGYDPSQLLFPICGYVGNESRSGIVYDPTPVHSPGESSIVYDPTPFRPDALDVRNYSKFMQMPYDIQLISKGLRQNIEYAPARRDSDVYQEVTHVSDARIPKSDFVAILDETDSSVLNLCEEIVIPKSILPSTFSVRIDLKDESGLTCQSLRYDSSVRALKGTSETPTCAPDIFVSNVGNSFIKVTAASCDKNTASFNVYMRQLIPTIPIQRSPWICVGSIGSLTTLTKDTNFSPLSRKNKFSKVNKNYAGISLAQGTNTKSGSKVFSLNNAMSKEGAVLVRVTPVGSTNTESGMFASSVVKSENSKPFTQKSCCLIPTLHEEGIAIRVTAMPWEYRKCRLLRRNVTINEQTLRPVQSTHSGAKSWVTPGIIPPLDGGGVLDFHAYEYALEVHTHTGEKLILGNTLIEYVKPTRVIQLSHRDVRIVDEDRSGTLQNDVLGKSGNSLAGRNRSIDSSNDTKLASTANNASIYGKSPTAHKKIVSFTIDTVSTKSDAKLLLEALTDAGLSGRYTDDIDMFRSQIDTLQMMSIDRVDMSTGERHHIGDYHTGGSNSVLVVDAGLLSPPPVTGTTYLYRVSLYLSSVEDVIDSMKDDTFSPELDEPRDTLAISKMRQAIFNLRENSKSKEKSELESIKMKAIMTNTIPIGERGDCRGRDTGKKSAFIENFTGIVYDIHVNTNEQNKSNNMTIKKPTRDNATGSVILRWNASIPNIDYWTISAKKIGVSLVCGVCHGSSSNKKTGTYVFVDKLHSTFSGTITYTITAIDMNGNAKHKDKVTTVLKPVIECRKSSNSMGSYKSSNTSDKAIVTEGGS